MQLKRVGDYNLLFVMAVEHEYGAHLKQRFTPLFTGVGPIEAAIGLTRALEQLSNFGTMPDLIISLGSAGSANLEQTEIYQASSISYRDMDASPLGFEKGVTPFLDHSAKIKIPIKIRGIKRASLSSGADIISGEDYKNIDSDMVDMESFAILRVCQQYNLPIISLRGISDGQKQLVKIADWTQFLHIIDEKLAKAVDIMQMQIEREELDFRPKYAN